ncbi:hypothetical protein [Pelosinus baikalensis]|uniref:Uncharacterized protein n=1 Tax=Pelosinus baikalensis TaxID=2892015 RepID=A0ABS8HVE5_9FIRM|nr:hypothetical protein [Pelosinus baikalensis]MCC5467134.1 hypothetical protein [Pelosinus baikalensis]
MIEAKCADSVMNITESEIRRFLSIFGEMDLVDSQVGRRGSCLTAKGQQFVTWLKGNSILS